MRAAIVSLACLMFGDSFDEWGVEEWAEEKRPRDAAIDVAKDDLELFFEQNAGTVFYLMQLEVMFEKKHYHWIVAKAVSELVREGRIKAKVLPLQKGASVKFLFSPRHRYWKRQAAASLAVIREYSDPAIAGACGEQADMLFFNALANRGFVSHGQDANEYEGRKWTASGHNLDFVLSCDGIAYGCEVKNTWGVHRQG